MRLLFCVLLLLSAALVQAQEHAVPAKDVSVKSRSLRKIIYGSKTIDSPKGQFYIGFGYNKEWYTKSDIHIKDQSGDWDFTLHKMTARDRPKFKEVFRVAVSIPQYGYRFGYWLPSSHFGIELNFDHAKYVIDEYQTVRLTGRINDNIYDLDTLVHPVNFFAMEHTDGANFLLLNLMFRRPLNQSRFVKVYGIAKLGGGIVIPRTDVTLFGNRVNNRFHIAGQIAGLETGLRIELFKYFWFEPTIKGVVANFSNVLAVGADERISHRFGAFMVLAHAGFNIPLGKVHSGKLPR
ncbi:MAG: hypothetical protein ACRC3B_06355 [Bacteroidia bacterium]